MTSSPLGRYSDVAATVAALAVLVTWLIVHGAEVFGIASKTDTTTLDAAATLVLGIVLGQRATMNGAGNVALAAHARLDAIGAPPLASLSPSGSHVPPPAPPPAGTP